MRTGGARLTLGLLAAVLVALTAGRPASAQDWLELSTARQADGIKSADVRIEFGAGTLTLRAARAGELYDAHIRYDASRFTPVRSFERSDGSATIRLGLKSLNGKDGVHIDWNGLETGDMDTDSHGASLEVGLSPDVPTDLSLAVGAAKSRLELGGLPLTDVTLETGASDTRLRFSDPNPSRMHELRIKAGAASLKADGLGNAHFDRIQVDGGVGDVTLDFSGDWTGDASGSIHMGLGSLTLKFPSDLGVEIDKTTVLASFNAAGFTKVAGGYRTTNWSSAARHLRLDVNAAFGSIDMEVEP